MHHNPTRILIILFLALMPSFLAHSAIDAPHNASCTISCNSCHNSSLPDSPLYTTSDINNFCTANCHNNVAAPYTDTSAPIVTTHMTKVCSDCHDPHNQGQKNWKNYYGIDYCLFKGRIDSYSDNGGGTYNINYSRGTFKSGWAAATIGDKTTSQRRPILLPNVRKLGWTFPVLAVTDNGEANGSKTGTMTMKGDLSQVYTYMNLPTDFAVIYGQYVRQKIDTDADDIYDADVKFFDNSGSYSFVKGDGSGICEVCHTQTGHFRKDGVGGDDPDHNNVGSVIGSNCTEVCHKHVNGFLHGGNPTGCSTAIVCHGTHQPHVSHVGESMIELACADCHDTDNYPQLKDHETLANTAVCTGCHSATGAVEAKAHFISADWVASDGEVGFCGSCHDATPGNSQQDGLGDAALNIMGDNATYGYFVTGHGRATTYPVLAWQDSAASGNPAANQSCSGCHNLTSQHFNNATKRLKTGYMDDAANSNCKQCHEPGVIATGNPQWYTTYAAYQNSAHSGKKCTACHDVHGMAGPYKAMAKGQVAVNSPTNAANLCYQCHKDQAAGGIENIAISGTTYNNDITEAFSESTKHPLGTSYTISGKTYTLQCTSCHNVHLVTGKYLQANTDKTPVTRISTPSNPAGNLTVWGDDAAEKMKAYAEAAGGKYEPPAVTVNASINSAKLPDYSTFCLDCHASAINSIVAKDWINNPHGKKTAGLTNMISGGGVGGSLYGGPVNCPNWTGCGRAIDWGQDSCNEAQAEADGDNECWPATPKGAGTSAWVNGAYNQEERNSGVNYVLSCTDCHEAHGSEKYDLMRKALNRLKDVADEELNSSRTEWGANGGVCVQCHEQNKTREHNYNPGWHNYGTCATGPCHQPTNTGHPPFGFSTCYGRCHSTTYVYDTDLMNDPAQWATFHQNRRGGLATQLAPAHEPGLVFHYKFEDNLKDSNMWNMHGMFVNGNGSYVAGKVGKAVQVNNNPVEVGTENAAWASNDYGKSGNISKLTEMKYNTTLETWVYPTSSPSDAIERKIMAKHFWPNDGGYAFLLRPWNSNTEYRVGFNVNVNGNSSGGQRGAYSTVSIPQNQWTHVAASFDKAGPDGTSGNLSVGRIRIYVNGNDVTTSDASGSWTEPGAGETYIFPFSDMRFKDLSRCADGSWCAAVLSVGGWNWSASDNFIGKLDEVKLWNITKPVSYFDAINAADPPRILSAVKGSAPNQLIVTFSEGVYNNNNATGVLVPTDFVFIDTDNGRTVTTVTHTAGSSTATLTLSSALDYTNDFGVDTVNAASTNTIFDKLGTAADITVVTISGDGGVAPSIVSAVVCAANKISITFSKGVYTNTGASGALVVSDFVFTDTDNGRTITAVTHTAGGTTATLTLSTNLDDSNDIGVDTVKAASNQIFDDLSWPMGTTAVTITGSLCPAVPAIFPLNETSGSTTVQDDQGYMVGAVSGTTTPVMTGSTFSGNGTDNHIVFANNDGCLRASTALTIEARIKPAVGSLTGTANKILRITGKDDKSDNTNTLYQLSVWRNNGAANIGISGSPAGTYNASGEASIAFWYRSSWSDGGLYDVVLTNYSGAATAGEKNCPIVSDHWYEVRLVYNSGKATIPGDIFVDDQGTTGNDDGSEMWSGYINCTDANQSLYNAAANNKAIIGATISSSGTGGDFTIGTDPVTPTSNPGNHFNGLLDWIKLQPDIADYTGVDDPAL